MPTICYRGSKAPAAPTLWGISVEIKLVGNQRAEIKGPDDTLSGLLSINSEPAYNELRAVRIQLEGHAISRFSSKVDNRVTRVGKDDIFMPDESPESQQSLCVYVIGERNAPWERSEKLPRGLHSFPFKISLSGQNFPAVFQSDFGRIQYKLVCYVAQGWREEIPACEKILKSKGHFNLTSDPSLSLPLVVTKTKNKSFFSSSSRTLLSVSLYLEKRGYLPGENLNFPLVLENPAREKIVKMQVTLVQKIIYFVNKLSKATRAVLGEEETHCNSHEEEVRWETGFLLPGYLMPTFTNEKKSIEIVYVLEFTVTTAGSSTLKGVADIVIGRVEGAAASANVPANEAERRDSEDSNWDTISIQTFATLPPGYSTLSSRSSSIETLPPSYLEVCAQGNWEDSLSEQEFRPRCASNVM